MKNKIIKTLVFDKQVRLFFVDNTALINDIIRLNLYPHRIINVALSKVVSGVSLLSATLKGEQRLSTTVIMSNPKYKIFADADTYGNIRGYANESLARANDVEGLSTLIGPKASIRMIKGNNMNQFTGITDMPYQSIDEDISHYYRQSEQIETYIETNIAFRKDHTILHSYAMYVQLLPGASRHLLNEIRGILDTKANFFKKLKNMDAKQISEELKSYFSDIVILGEDKVQFSCGCSKEMFYGLLYSLDKKVVMKYIDANEPVESSCHICGRKYLFHPSEIKQLL